jgi:hypothetical protein
MYNNMQTIPVSLKIAGIDYAGIGHNTSQSNYCYVRFHPKSASNNNWSDWEVFFSSAGENDTKSKSFMVYNRSNSMQIKVGNNGINYTSITINNVIFNGVDDIGWIDNDLVGNPSTKTYKFREFINVTIHISNDTNAHTDKSAFVRFLNIKDQWTTEKQEFFGSATKGEVITKEFQTNGVPKLIEISSNLNDGFKYDKLVINNMAITHNVGWIDDNSFVHPSYRRHIIKFNDCEDFSSINSLDDNGKPFCLTSLYDNAHRECVKAINIEESGLIRESSSELSNLWDNTYNLLIGNTIDNNNKILKDVKNRCNQWITSYYEEIESSQCNIEPQVQYPHDPILYKSTNDWKNSSVEYIDLLMDRLELIKKYIEIYPNILKLEERNVSFISHSMGSLIKMKYHSNELVDDVAPVQYLEMVLSNGKPGPIGRPGPIGLKGESRKLGPIGKSGNSGDPTLPSGFM